MVDRVADWSTSATGNAAIAGINIAENCPYANLNNMGREIMAAIRQEFSDKGTTAVAAATTSVDGASEYKDLSGNTTITGFTTAVTGMYREIRVLGTPLIKYNATSLITPDASDFQAAADDILHLRSLGAGNWFMTVNRKTTPGISVATANIQDSAVTTAKINNNAVTFAKMQAITDGKLLGASGGTAVEEISIGPGLTLAANTLSASSGTITALGTPASITLSNTNVFAHGIGSRPKSFGAYLVAGGTPELGYTAGDYVNIADFQNGASNARAVSVKADATNVTVTWSSSAPFLLNTSTFSASAIDITKWTIVPWAHS